MHLVTAGQTGSELNMHIIGEGPDAPQAWGMGFMVRDPSDPEGFFGDLFPPGSFGRPGSSGCLLAVSPADGIAIAYVSNRRATTGLAPFIERSTIVLNGVLATLTSREHSLGSPS